MPCVTKGVYLFMGNPSNNTINQFVKECIYTSLTTLMENQEFRDITITDITRKAGVSRMAYYRNYSSKEEILTGYLDELFQIYLSGLIEHDQIDAHQFTYKFFVYFRQHKTLILNLIRADLSLLILNRFDKYLFSIFEKLINRYPPTTSDTLYIHFLAGGLYKILIEWIENDLKESDEEMTSFMVRQYHMS